MARVANLMLYLRLRYGIYAQVLLSEKKYLVIELMFFYVWCQGREDDFVINA